MSSVGGKRSVIKMLPRPLEYTNKGSYPIFVKVGGVIYPVAIKYDPKFGDAFWNSSEVIVLIFPRS